MSDGWWQRHLGRQFAPPPVAPAPVNYPQKAVRWQESYPPTGPRQEVGNGQPEGTGDDTYIRVRTQGWDQKAPGNIGQTSRCPGCGGGNYFRRKWANAECAPLCTDCGYNGEFFTQTGNMLNAIGMKSSGPIQAARSDNPDATPHFEVHPEVSSEFSWANVR